MNDIKNNTSLESGNKSIHVSLSYEDLENINCGIQYVIRDKNSALADELDADLDHPDCIEIAEQKATFEKLSLKIVESLKALKAFDDRESGQYRVVWETDIFDAANEVDAARQALKIQRDPESIATIFMVDGAEIDLDEIDSVEAERSEHVQLTVPKEINAGLGDRLTALELAVAKPSESGSEPCDSASLRARYGYG